MGLSDSSLACTVANHGEDIVALRSYGVLKGKAIEVRLGAGQRPHYQVRIVDNTIDYRIAINVKSQLAPSEVELSSSNASTIRSRDGRATAARIYRAGAKTRLGRARLHPWRSLRPRDMRPLPSASRASTTTSTRRSTASCNAPSATKPRWSTPSASAGGLNRGQGQVLRLPAGERHPRHPHEPG